MSRCSGARCSDIRQRSSVFPRCSRLWEPTGGRQPSSGLLRSTHHNIHLRAHRVQLSAWSISSCMMMVMDAPPIPPTTRLPEPTWPVTIQSCPCFRNETTPAVAFAAGSFSCAGGVLQGIRFRNHSRVARAFSSRLAYLLHHGTPVCLGRRCSGPAASDAVAGVY